MISIAAAEGAAFGALGAGGASLVLAALLILGVKGKGKVRLGNNPAMIVAFVAGTSFHTAGQIWTNPERITAQGLTGLGVGTGSGPFGNVGVGAVCALLLVAMLCWQLTPLRGAILGLIAAIVWPLAGNGTVWALPVELGAAVLLMAGG